MKSVVCPELSTAAAGSPQAPTAAVDNSAPSSTHPEPTYKSGKAVQITGTTSGCGNLARLGFRYAVTTGRPMKEECGVLLALRRPARDWRFGSQRCETGAVLLAFAIRHHMQHAVQPV